MKPAFSFLIGLFGLAAGAVPLLAVEDVKPNVVFCLADDLGFMDIGANNPRTFYETPNIDRLAAKGMALHERSLELPGVLVFAGEPDDRQVSPRTGVTDYSSQLWQPGGRAVRVRSRRRLEADRMV